MSEEAAGRASRSRLRAAVWVIFVVAALFLLNIDYLELWAGVVVTFGLVLAAIPALRPSPPKRRVDTRDLVAIGVLYVAVVAAFRLAFIVFTTDSALGLFLSFAAGMILGVVGPVVYQVWVRGRDLRSIGLGAHRLRSTLALGVVFATVQFSTTLWGYDLPAPFDWVPLLVMSVVVGLFEAVFFRGFIQSRLETSFGVVPAVGGAAALYALYHVGYGMGGEEIWFLFGLGVVYAVVYRLTNNVLIVWPLLTPLGAFFNNLQAGDIDLPWASILGFADVAAVMAVAVWLAHRHVRKTTQHPSSAPVKEKVPA